MVKRFLAPVFCRSQRRSATVTRKEPIRAKRRRRHRQRNEALPITKQFHIEFSPILPRILIAHMEGTMEAEL
jgi:hypothetical protein